MCAYVNIYKIGKISRFSGSRNKYSPKRLYYHKNVPEENKSFLYIPSNSSHPPGLLKSLIFGLSLTCFNQNKDTNDFLEMTCLLLRRLLNMGHKYETLEPVFQSAVQQIETMAKSHFKPTPSPLLPSNNPLFYTYLTALKISPVSAYETSMMTLANPHSHASIITRQMVI